jgi:hypothetical protein
LIVFKNILMMLIIYLIFGLIFGQIKKKVGALSCWNGGSIWLNEKELKKM